MTLHRPFLLLILALALLVVANLAWARLRVQQAESARGAEGELLVRRLGLTDLALWSEARYTRHPSQADLFTPFQEFPGSLEHFPAGSLIAPPPRGEESRLFIRRGRGG